ncbi:MULTISPECIES: IS5 family transposase [Pseudomonadota]|nr:MULTISPECIES: IS5 family transposase [Pseudomonadota]HBO9989480.1 IS5 family transposase [Pseudomonas aeruginosa]MDH0371746.1 IS5 family transposase [Comamonas aquatica]MDH0493689.1 IS5 family transposase [Comamonas aquatica]MDH0496382.1 IS5 family transposase [Comamonas aquatica]MDH0900802.1 IS5 family transposase [Comamonas aquatica]
MSRAPISKELWKQLEPLIPPFVPSRKGGRRKRTISDEAALNGILYVLQTGIPWEDLPKALGYGSGMTCWRRLREWNAAGVWEQLHHAMLVRLREHDQIDWSRACIDGSSGAKPPGGQETGPNPTDRGKLGSKRHIIVDAQGIPLVVLVSGANRHDSMMFETCVDAIPAVKGLKGRPRRRPYKLHADKGYDYARCRVHLRKRGILSRIARRGVESREKLGKHRWVVERTHGWFAGFGKLRIRFERQLDTHLALLKLAAAIICARFVDRLC